MNKNSTVDVWFADYNNPMKELVQAVRETILAADPRIKESSTARTGFNNLMRLMLSLRRE